VPWRHARQNAGRMSTLSAGTAQTKRVVILHGTGGGASKPAAPGCDDKYLKISAVATVKMKISSNVVKMSEVLPLALLNLRGKIATAKNLHPERLGTLRARYCSVMRQVREEKDLSIEELSALSGSSKNFLEAAESVNLEMTDDDLKTLHEVYWELATGEDNPGDFKRLANQRLATPTPEIGSEMREIRQRKELSINELSTLSGLPADILERAESGTVEMIDEVSKKVKKVYWSLSALEATPAEYRRLLAEMGMKANGD
jgi:transcriptional regulator with XRE-family HTH domain